MLQSQIISQNPSHSRYPIRGSTPDLVLRIDSVSVIVHAHRVEAKTLELFPAFEGQSNFWPRFHSHAFGRAFAARLSTLQDLRYYRAA